ncbi:hypothetical protein BBW65_07510 [Helicobacter enhydrae]|uniref:AMIN domain-containing protein n=1 Tax=Helicobacter enhydrae TaxID=222136 RepID=A0A1B1U796_9HELI|nr:AMIN domain-containing protein [Helicobacter enhydrae]ANV98653.1 hypothetical protein BBW65_07510 [Helicobacter enhydrae]
MTMIRMCLFLMIVCGLFGREDPFELKITPKTTPQSVEGENKNFLEDIKVQLPSTARILKEVQFVYQKLDGSIDIQKIPVNSTIDWHYPISISQLYGSAKDKILQKEQKYDYKNFSFVIKNKEIHIHTPYQLTQNFILPKPFRIILDFTRSKDTLTQEFQTQSHFFSSITINTHQTFYRVILTLDGQYDYDIQQDKDAKHCYIVTLQ